MGKTLLNKLKQTGKRALPFILAANMLNPLNAQQPEKKDKNDWLYHGLEAGYITFNIVDYFTTQYALEYGAQELNPIAKHFIHNKTISALVKGGVSLTTLYYLRELKEENPKLAYAFLIGLNAVYGQLAYRNIKLNISLDLDR